MAYGLKACSCHPLINESVHAVQCQVCSVWFARSFWIFLTKMGGVFLTPHWLTGEKQCQRKRV